MLGWEFPPSISGGLGTACRGLTRGLSGLGVNLTLVLPRTNGGEDSKGFELLDASRLAAPRLRRRREYVQSATARKPKKDPASPVLSKQSLKLLGVDSPLRPYQTAEHYEAEANTPATRERGRPPVSSHRRASRFHLAHPRHRSAPIAGGSYGGSLRDEVSRYADVVGELSGTERFDVIHAHDWMTYPAGLKAKELSGRPLVVHVHSCEYDRAGANIDPRIRDVEQLGFDGADAIVCVSHHTARRLQENYRVDADKIQVVHNGVEAMPFEGSVASREPMIVFLGRMTWQKGLDFLLAAARRVVDVDGGVRFVLAGDGDLFPTTVERAARMGLARNVRFTRFLESDAIRDLFSRASGVVMPSISEPFGLVALEAVSAGVPVLVSRQSGVSEVLTSSLKVDFWKVDELANKILALVHRPALRQVLVERGRDEVLRLGWDRSALVLLGVYRELLA